MLHGLSAFVENAIDFAASIVEVTAYYDAEMLQIEVRDGRAGLSARRDGAPGRALRHHASPGGETAAPTISAWGWAFFIAKTLLERTGATVEFRNARRGGAVISTRWARRRVEAPSEPEF